jgi:hypothetical protein
MTICISCWAALYQPVFFGFKAVPPGTSVKQYKPDNRVPQNRTSMLILTHTRVIAAAQLWGFDVVARFEPPQLRLIVEKEFNRDHGLQLTDLYFEDPAFLIRFHNPYQRVIERFVDASWHGSGGRVRPPLSQLVAD